MRPWALFVAVVVFLAASFAAAESLAEGSGWLDWFFGAVVYSAVLVVIGACGHAIRVARRERRTDGEAEGCRP